MQLLHHLLYMYNFEPSNWEKTHSWSITSITRHSFKFYVQLYDRVCINSWPNQTLGKSSQETLVEPNTQWLETRSGMIAV